MTTETINVTPTWKNILPYLLTVYSDASTPEGRQVAEDELRRMAALADRYVALSRVPTGTPSNWNE